VLGDKKMDRLNTVFRKASDFRVVEVDFAKSVLIKDVLRVLVVEGVLACDARDVRSLIFSLTYGRRYIRC
jgi:hypothetical protein